MLRKIQLVLLSIGGLSGMLAAQDQRRLEFHIGGLHDKDTVYLANYYGNRLYYADTTRSDGRGNVLFARAKGYKSGVYAVVVPGPKYFEFIINEPEVKMETDNSDLTAKMAVKKSLENQIFYDYIRWLADRKKDGDVLREKKEAATDPIARAGIVAQLDDLDAQVKKYQADLVAHNPNTFVARIVSMSMPTDQTEIKRPDGTVDSSATYYHYRAHFWDNTDLTDERIMRTPVFQNKLEEYIGKIVPQVPDTINRLADELIDRLGPSDELYKFVVSNITNKYGESEIMGMDAVYVHMALTYYCLPAGEKTRMTGMDQDKLKKLCERANKMAPLVIGAKARDIILPDTTEQNWQGFHRLPQDYLLLVFWDPHCGHCKKALPDIHKQYVEKLKPIGIEVFAVAKATDSTLFADWKKFIRENDLDWVNVGLTQHVYADAKKDPSKYIPKFTTVESLNYMDTWDVYSTPKFYVVDADRKIVGKQITPDQIVDLVTKLREAKAKREAKP